MTNNMIPDERVQGAAAEVGTSDSAMQGMRMMDDEHDHQIPAILFDVDGCLISSGGAGRICGHPLNAACLLVPPSIRRKHDVARTYYDDTGRCIYCDVREGIGLSCTPSTLPYWSRLPHRPLMRLGTCPTGMWLLLGM